METRKTIIGTMTNEIKKVIIDERSETIISKMLAFTDHCSRISLSDANFINSFAYSQPSHLGSNSPVILFFTNLFFTRTRRLRFFF